VKLETNDPMSLRDRTTWHLSANAPVAAWLTALFGVAPFHRYVPESPWLLVHLLLLGAVTNAILSCADAPPPRHGAGRHCGWSRSTLASSRSSPAWSALTGC